MTNLTETVVPENLHGLFWGLRSDVSKNRKLVMSEYYAFDTVVFVGPKDNEDDMSRQAEVEFEAKTQSIVSEFRLLAVLDVSDERLMTVGEHLFRKGLVRLKDLADKTPDDVLSGLDVDHLTRRKFIETVRYLGPYL